MRVAIVNTGTTGGAATAALRLHKGLRSIDVDSRFICRDTTSSSEHIDAATLNRRPIAEIACSFVKERLAIPDRRPSYGLSGTAKVATCELFSDCKSELGRRRSLPGGPFDIINLHWISQFLDLQTILKTYAGKVPIVWTLHDMNAFTGGCHYDAGCGKFSERCFECPQLRFPSPTDASHQIFQSKQRLLSSIDPKDLHFVTPSVWLAEQVKNSKLLSRFPVTVIPNGVDTELFRPISPKSARESLGIAVDDQVILFVAESINNPRKGIDLLIDALGSMRFERPTTFVSVGRGQVDLPPIDNVTTLRLGPITNPHFMPVVYSAADIFVIPSRQDNLPNTILESLACGTPVVGFPIGGVPEPLAQTGTSCIASMLDSNSLAKAIQDALGAQKEPSPRLAYRQCAVEQFGIHGQALRYKNLFQVLTNSESEEQSVSTKRG